MPGWGVECADVGSTQPEESQSPPLPRPGSDRPRKGHPHAFGIPYYPCIPTYPYPSRHAHSRPAPTRPTPSAAARSRSRRSRGGDRRPGVRRPVRHGDGIPGRDRPLRPGRHAAPTGAGLVLNAPIVSGAVTPDGRGYWLVGADGGVFAFGDAGFYGSTGALHLISPDRRASTSTTNGRGYWEVAADGGVFAFGDAGFHGSASGRPLAGPIVGHGPHGPGRRLLAGRLRRRRASPSVTPATTARPSTCRRPAPSSASRRRPTTAGTGRSPPTATSTPSATPGSTATPRSVAPAVGITDASGGLPGRLHATAAPSPSAAPPTGARWPGCRLNKPIVATSATRGGYLDVAADGGVFNFGSVGYYGSLGAARCTPRRRLRRHRHRRRPPRSPLR